MTRACLIAILCCAATLFAPAGAKAGEPTPLFSDDAPLDITITGPIRELVRGMSRSPTPYDATLVIKGTETEAHAVTISARGKSRRRKENCQFPPIRIRIKEKPTKASLFHRQRSLKLVTHCRKTMAFQRHTFLEYTAYKLFNVATDTSFRVRLAEISYVDEKSGKEIIRRFGFLIEDVDDLAKRVDLKEVSIERASRAQLNAQSTATVTLFQYMIGNLDWGVLQGPTGDECCHNAKLIGSSKQAQSDLTPVPYDFDYAGLVDAPYAVPPANVNVSRVTSRVYRGFCDFNAETRVAAETFRQKKPAFMAAIETAPGLSERATKSVKKYLEGFFKAIADDATLEKKLLSNCR